MEAGISIDTVANLLCLFPVHSGFLISFLFLIIMLALTLTFKGFLHSAIYERQDRSSPIGRFIIYLLISFSAFRKNDAFSAERVHTNAL